MLVRGRLENMRVGSGLVMQSRIGTGLSRVKNSIGQGLTAIPDNNPQAQNSGRQSHFYSNFKQSQGLSQIQKSSPGGGGPQAVGGIAPP